MKKEPLKEKKNTTKNKKKKNSNQQTNRRKRTESKKKKNNKIEPIEQNKEIKKEEKRMKTKLKLKKNILIILLLSIVFFISIYKLAHFYIDLEKNNRLNEKLIQEVLNDEVSANEEDKELKEILTINFEKLISMNSDTIGWIRFNDNKVNNPLVQTQDNNYYLDHSFQKKKNSLGTLFIDYRNHNLEDQNVVIFGHNAVDDSMFGSLINIFEKDFFENEEHKIIEIIDTNEITHTYEIFSYYVIEKEEYYITTAFSNQNEFQEFLNTIKKRSIRNFNTSLTTKDKILTLSTCNGNGGTTKRTVIHAKKIS